MALRQLIEIDEARCNGCGQCLLDCAEGALELVNGKARVVSDILCDGLGACLSGCPRDALHLVWREAPDFDEEAVRARRQGLADAGCRGGQAEIFSTRPSGEQASARGTGRAVPHWPLKLRLVPAGAVFLDQADISLVADCAAPASPDFHELVRDRVVMLACPKFEDKEGIRKKLVELFRSASIRDVEVLRMEVPCCAPLTRLCQEAAREAGLAVEVRERILGRDGGLLKTPAGRLL